jgi:hypothetical protein
MADRRGGDTDPDHGAASARETGESTGAEVRAILAIAAMALCSGCMAYRIEVGNPVDLKLKSVHFLQRREMPELDISTKNATNGRLRNYKTGADAEGIKATGAAVGAAAKAVVK